MSEQSEPYEKRFGNLAIEKGIITPEQLIEALKNQVTGEIRGKFRLIGEILLDLKYMTPDQFEEVLDVLIKD